jgi:hypothetical protein
MLFNDDLENIILKRHEIIEADELNIISGYLGPSPVGKLSELPFDAKVIYGMYGESGIGSDLHDSLMAVERKNDNIHIYYSTVPVHAKCYVWKKDNRIVHALIGSANFSTNGLCTPYREVLAETTADTFKPLSKYLGYIFENSLDPKTDLEQNLIEKTVFPDGTKPCKLLLVNASGEVQNVAGLNWGQNPNNHTNPNDAYVPIRKEIIRNFPFYFPPKTEYPSDSSGGRPRRHNDKVEIIWDDGVTMDALLEGSQDELGVIYPKQISSFPEKRIMGEYLRTRLGVPMGGPVTRHHLESYGRLDVDVSMSSPGVFLFDFSTSR